MTCLFKRICLTILGLVLCSSFFTVNLNAKLDFGLDFNTRYIWRGFDLNPNNEPVLQPSVTYSFGDTGFSVNVWGSFSFQDSELHETDITLAYDFSASKDLSISLGFIHYGWYFTEGFQFEDHTTQEFYISAGLSKVPLNPTLTLYYDINNGDGLYASLGIGHALKLSKSHSLNLSATLGYNGGQWIEGSGFSQIDLSASLPLQINKVSVSPFLGATIVLLDEVNPDDNVEIYTGVSLAF